MAVLARTSVLVALSHLVEIILVELADEAREIAVLEMLGEDGLGELLILHGGR